jgi:hypothetical protein
LQNITVEIDGKTVELVPTVGALKKISAIYNGLNPAAVNCRNFELGTIATVIGVGIGKTKVDEVVELEEILFANGLAKYVNPAADFCERLANSGRPAAEGKESPKATPAKKST